LAPIRATPFVITSCTQSDLAGGASRSIGSADTMNPTGKWRFTFRDFVIDASDADLFGFTLDHWGRQRQSDAIIHPVSHKIGVKLIPGPARFIVHTDIDPVAPFSGQAVIEPTTAAINSHEQTAQRLAPGRNRSTPVKCILSNL
jgi:hypothetical protein